MRDKYFSSNSIKWLALIVIFNMAGYTGAKIITGSRHHYDLSLPIDRMIPFLPITVIIYLGCYLFWAVNYVLAIGEGGDAAKKFALSDIMGEAVCFLVYLVFPTTMLRPEITGDSVWEQALQIVYSLDAADNLFPSIHCLVSWFSYLGVRDILEIPTWYKKVSMISAFLVFISTLTVKQHVAVDVLAGYLLAEVSYRVCHWKTGNEKVGTGGGSGFLYGKAVIKFSTYALLFFFTAFLLVLIKAWINGKFSSVDTFQNYMAGFGIFAPIMLAMFQAAQVIIPVLPGFVGCAAGAVMFGSMGGFWCNYIGISAGSVAAFLLARKYGTGLVKDIFKGDRYDKWADRAAESKSYAAFMFVATLLPLFPDDYLCYLSGLTKMSAKKFVWIIILGKPWCILAYSLGFSLIG